MQDIVNQIDYMIMIEQIKIYLNRIDGGFTWLISLKLEGVYLHRMLR